MFWENPPTNYHKFTDTEVPSLCPQPASGMHHEPHKSRPHPPILFLRYILIRVFRLCLILPSLLSPLEFCYWNSVRISFHSHVCHMPHTPDLFFFNHPTKIWCSLKIIKFSIMKYSLTPSCNYIFVHVFSSTHCSQTLCWVLQTKFHTHTK